MKKITYLCLIAISLFTAMAFINNNTNDGWESLFDGKSLNNCKGCCIYPPYCRGLIIIRYNLIDILEGVSLPKEGSKAI